MRRSTTDQTTLLERLDMQQNELLQALNELNLEIENVINQWTNKGSNAEEVQGPLS